MTLDNWLKERPSEPVRRHSGPMISHKQIILAILSEKQPMSQRKLWEEVSRKVAILRRQGKNIATISDKQFKNQIKNLFERNEIYQISFQLYAA